MTAAEKIQLERLVSRMAEGLGTSVKLSHLLRAVAAILINAEAELLRQVELAGMMQRPPNDDRVRLAQFERQLAQLVAKALRDAPGPR